MFLKSLTLKGFKSFADSTTLNLEPGVTVVVGPNGSGKSNVVDAVAWVLGAQAPSAMRSQKMDDVIFSGTATRPALGRAEVTLTLDKMAAGGIYDQLAGGFARYSVDERWLVPDLMVSATLDFVNTVPSRHPDDWSALVSHVQAIDVAALERYLGLLTTTGPLRVHDK